MERLVVDEHCTLSMTSISQEPWWGVWWRAVLNFTQGGEDRCIRNKKEAMNKTTANRATNKRLTSTNTWPWYTESQELRVKQDTGEGDWDIAGDIGNCSYAWVQHNHETQQRIVSRVWKKAEVEEDCVCWW